MMMVRMQRILIGTFSPQRLLQKFGSPLYVYDAEMIQTRCQELKKAFPRMRLYYACKANTNAELIRLIVGAGFDVETVSPGEIATARRVGVPLSRIVFTCGNVSERELVSIVRSGVVVHLDSLTQVEIFGKHFPGRTISVRLNQGIGAGHHAHVITGGPESKFGVDITHVPKLQALAKKYRLRITGLHQHIGSNVLDAAIFLKAMDALFKTALRFPDLKHLDFGGGFGVPYAPGEKRLSIQKIGRAVQARTKQFFSQYGRKIELSFEPGRYLVAEAGSLLVTVNDVKRNPRKTFVGVDSGMGHLIRPAMYGSHHEIVNATHPHNKKERVTVAGYYCESGDVLAKDRLIPTPEIGDILCIKNTGAYGYVMSSGYNLRERPAEVLVQRDKTFLIRKRGS